MSKKTQTLQRAPVVITAHTNADFDSFAAIIAASKLYPEAALVFPGSQEATLKNFFIQSAIYLFNFVDAKIIDPASVETLVVVDTRALSRLKHVRPVLERWRRGDGVALHVWDHHPPPQDPEDDLVPDGDPEKLDGGLILPWGAAASILVTQIQERGLELSAEEATMIGLGLYEDTGSLSFSSTTTHDFLAGAFLRSQGMDLNVITDLLQRDLTAEQISILNDLLESAQTHEINGVPVVIAEVTMDEYMGDFALLAHKLLDMENIRVLFALGLMRDRIHMVARSRTPDVDVGVICASLGGGGHSYAASATVKNRTLAQVKEELFALLYSHINPHKLVRDLMTTPVICVQADDPIDDAVEVMTRYGLKAVPVLWPEESGGGCAGVLDHHIADKAKAHGLGYVSVETYMQRDCAIVHPTSDLFPVMEIIVGQGQRLAPVVEDGKVTGVITRTDLINTLIDEPARIPESLIPEKNRERNIRSQLAERLPKDRLELLERAGRLAQEMGMEAYSVGGFVRDIMLRRKNLDIDIVVEGDGMAFGKRFAEVLDGRVRTHKKFRTAVIIYQPGPDPRGEPQKPQKVDVATARLEYYEYPAALPTVQLSSIKMDLSRRDFTINALAVQLNPGSFGRLVDFFGSQRDIKDRVVRVLHSLSFVEDPTRILRAIRFEQRYHFRIGKQTERLIKNAVSLNMMDRLSGRRVFNELRIMLKEKEFVNDIKRMDDFDLLGAIYPPLKLTDKCEALLKELEKVINWHALLYEDREPRQWMLALLGLAAYMKQEDAMGFTHRLGMSPKEEREFHQMRESRQPLLDALARWTREQGKPSALYEILEPVPLEGLLFAMAAAAEAYGPMGEALRKHVSLYLTKLRHIKPQITGNHLKTMGLPPGPRYSEILREIQRAKLDGDAPSLFTELGLAEKLVRESL